MKKEIETRFLEIDKDGLINRLRELRATDKGEEKLVERIFHASGDAWAGQNKFIRLRKKNNRIILTFKHNPGQKVDSAREVEFEVSSFEDCSEFLEQAGFVIVRDLEKLRHTFLLGKVTVDIDTWPRLPTYAEFEGPDIESLKRASSSVGYEWEKRFDGDAREVFIHYKFDLDNISVITFNELKYEERKKL